MKQVVVYAVLGNNYSLESVAKGFPRSIYPTAEEAYRAAAMNGFDRSDGRAIKFTITEAEELN